MTGQFHHQQAGLYPTDSHQDNLATVNSSPAAGVPVIRSGYGSQHSGSRIVHIEGKRTEVCIPSQRHVIAAARRQANASIKMASNMFTLKREIHT